MTFEQAAEELKAEIRELGKIILDPLAQERQKIWASFRLGLITERLKNLNSSVKEVNNDQNTNSFKV